MSSLLRNAAKPLVIIGKGAAYSRAEQEIRQFADMTNLPLLATPMGKGVVPDDHGQLVAATRSTALQGADTVLLLGARLNWMLHFGQQPRWANNVTFIQVTGHFLKSELTSIFRLTFVLRRWATQPRTVLLCKVISRRLCPCCVTAYKDGDIQTLLHGGRHSEPRWNKMWLPPRLWFKTIHSLSTIMLLLILSANI